MAAVYEDNLKKDLSSGRLARCYLLFGDDAYLKKLYMDKIAGQACTGDTFFNLQKFTGDCDLQDVYDAVTQYPMMAESKCVLLTDYDFEHAAKSDFDRLCTLLTETNDTCVLVLRFDSVEFDIKRSSKAKKLIAAAEKGNGRAVRLDHRRPAELVRMLTEGAGKRGYKLDSVVAKYLIETAGSDTNILKNELDKLCCYAPGAVIDKSTIDLVCIKSVEASVYNLTREIFSCNLSGALQMLDDLFFMRLEPMIVLYTISSSYVELYRVATAKKQGLALSQVAAKFGYRGREFVLERAADNLRRFDNEKILYSFDAILAADRALKSFGGEPRTVLEELVVHLVYILIKGGPVD